MDPLTWFGLVAVGLMLVCYAMEPRSPAWTIALVGTCRLGSTVDFLQGVWPFGLVQAIWALVAQRCWQRARG